MKAKEFAHATSEFSYETSLALNQMDAEQEVTAESLVRCLFEALKRARNDTRRLDSLLLASEGDLPERLRGMGIECSDDEVQTLIDQFGRNYCW